MAQTKQVIQNGSTVEVAIDLACKTLGVLPEHCEIEIVKHPKKSFFGLLKTHAQVKVVVISQGNPPEHKESLYHEPALTATQHNAVPPVALQTEQSATSVLAAHQDKLKAATTFLQDVITKMGVTDVVIEAKAQDNGAIFLISGADIGVLIGRHGETMDALQYLTTLAVSRIEGKYFRLSLDCAEYREKRTLALKEMARKTASKVKQTGKSRVLDSMNPYERRMIHEEIAKIDGVGSKSKGDEPGRRVLVFALNKPSQPPILATKPASKKQQETTSPPFNSQENKNPPHQSEDSKKPIDALQADPTPIFSTSALELTLEERLRRERLQTEKSAKRYGEIDV